MAKYPLALFIGRFQPFHNGHKWGIERAMEKAERVWIGIGSSNVSNRDNPWSAAERRAMIMRAVTEEGWAEKIGAVLEIPDTPSDQEWVEQIKMIAQNSKLTAAEILIVSNNGWVTELMRAAGFRVYETGLYNREELEGQKIRALMLAGDDTWRRRVPAYLSDLQSLAR